MSMKTKQDCSLVLHRLGIMETDVVLIHHHSFLDSLIAKSATMIEALVEMVGEDGTIMTYQLMDFNQDPSNDSSISFDKRDRVRQELTDFDFKKYREIYYNPTFLAISKLNHRQFNQHPRLVVCAWGKYASLLTKGQPLDFPFGSESAFETLKQLNAKILVFEEDYQEVHELRHAYSSQPIQSISTQGVALGGQWTKYNDFKMDTSKYSQAMNLSDKKEVIVNNKKIQCFNFQEVLNQFIKLHPKRFKELGQ